LYPEWKESRFRCYLVPEEKESLNGS
jgi:hypothetical protein